MEASLDDGGFGFARHALNSTYFLARQYNEHSILWHAKQGNTSSSVVGPQGNCLYCVAETIVHCRLRRLAVVRERGPKGTVCVAETILRCKLRPRLRCKAATVNGIPCVGNTRNQLIVRRQNHNSGARLRLLTVDRVRETQETFLGALLESQLRCKAATVNRGRCAAHPRNNLLCVAESTIPVQGCDVTVDRVREPQGNSFVCVADNSMRCKTALVDHTTRAGNSKKQFVYLRTIQ
jgi:hypothetical protein